MTFASWGGTVITGCKAVYRKWYSLRLGRHAAEKEGHQCWSLLAAALRPRPDLHCSWMPSHRTAAEAAKMAIPEAWHRGNYEADDRAKQASLARDLPAVLLASHVAKRAVAEKVAAIATAIQLKRLKAAAARRAGQR